MTSKEYVKEKYPKAIVAHYMTRDPFDNNSYLKLSVKSYLESGKVSGSLLTAVDNIINE